MRDYHIGILNFFDLGLDFVDFLAREKDRSFEKAILGCLAPWFGSEVEIFCRSVEEPAKRALLADTTVEQGKEENSLIWEHADAKLRAARDLVHHPFAAIFREQ